MTENIPIFLFLLLIHQIHYLALSPLPFHTLAYALGMVEVRKSRQRRSQLAGTTYPFDAKCRVRSLDKQRRDGEEEGNEGWIGKGSSERDSQHESASDSCELSKGESLESLDLTDMSRSFPFSEKVGVGEILESEWDVDEEIWSDDDEISLGDFFKVMENPQHILDGGSSSEPEKVRLPSELVELTGEPESNHAEQALDDSTPLDHFSHSSYEEPPGRKFLREKQTGQRESLNGSLPLSLLIPAHARAKSNRRSLQCIPPLLERKAKLPLGPADSPRN